MDLKNILKDITLPPVVVKVDEDSMRNLFVAVFFLGVMLMVVNVVIKKATA